MRKTEASNMIGRRSGKTYTQHSFERTHQQQNISTTEHHIQIGFDHSAISQKGPTRIASHFIGRNFTALPAENIKNPHRLASLSNPKVFRIRCAINALDKCTDPNCGNNIGVVVIVDVEEYRFRNTSLLFWL